MNGINYRITNTSNKSIYRQKIKQLPNILEVNKDTKQNPIHHSRTVFVALQAYNLSFKGNICPKPKYIPNGLADVDKIAEILLKIEVGNANRFTNNSKFKNAIATLKMYPETIQYLDSLLTARDEKLPISEIRMFLHSIAKSKDFGKYLKPLLNTQIPCSDIRFIFSNLNKEKEPYLSKLLRVKNRELSSTCILNTLNKDNEKYLDELLSARDGKITEEAISNILCELDNFKGKNLNKLLTNSKINEDTIPSILHNLNEDNEKCLDKLLSNEAVKNDEISSILCVLNTDNQQYLDTLLNAKKSKKIYIHNILASLNKNNEEHLDELLNNKELFSSDIAIILDKLNKDNKIPIDKLIHDQILFKLQQTSHRRNYPDETKALMNEMRDVAISLNLPDFYSGKRFDTKNNPEATIEHLVPYYEKADAFEEGFYVNDLANLVPVEEHLNSNRGRTPLREWYKQNPQYLENSKAALVEYEKINTSLINGKEWVAQLKLTLNKQLGYIAFP